MKCAGCATDSPRGNKHHPKCRAILTFDTQVCPTCGAANPVRSEFCGTCGTNLVDLKQKTPAQCSERLADRPATQYLWHGDDVKGLKLHLALASGYSGIMHYSGHAVFINPRIPDERGPLLATCDVVIAQTTQRTPRG